MRRKGAAGNTPETGRANSHSLLGIAVGRLALKLPRRIHMAPGAILTRFCCCGGHDPQGKDLRVPQLLCLVCSVWPIVRERVVVGEPIGYQLPNLTWLLGSIGARFNWPAADELGTHPLRFVAARALMTAGGTFAQLLRAGQWRRNAARFSPNVSEGERRPAADISTDGPADESLAVALPPFS